MSFALFGYIVVLIIFSAVILTLSSALVVEYMLYRIKEMQAEAMAWSVDHDLDEHAADNPNMQFFNKN